MDGPITLSKNRSPLKSTFMFLKLAHTNLDAFKYAKKLTLEIYKITRSFPDDERFVLTRQLRRAAISVQLNVAEGASRNSENERKRYYEIARGSLVEVDTAIGIAVDLNYVSVENLAKLGSQIVNSFKVLSGLIEAKPKFK